MATVYKIPVAPTPLSMSIVLAGVTYKLRFAYANVPDAGWFMDIADRNGNSIVAGIPLVTGADLLAQYGYLGFGGKLFVRSDGVPDQVPGYADLGVNSFLYWVPN